MPNPNQFDPRTHFAVRFLPWLLGGAMLAAYLLMLNHWVTLLNLNQVAAISGLNWQPQIYGPLTYLFTLPFRWLAAAQVPLALNIFAAVTAAITLAVLARSVAILPHDRTEMERTRERSDFCFLTSWIAWVPPVAAVIFAGFQLGFWEHATSFTGEMFNLLWFAVIIWQFLEYRLDEREGRLFLAAFLYGAGMTENWALIAFFPLFLMMIIWLRKLDFFNLRFLLKMSVWGLAGLLLIFLLPLKACLATEFPVPFWDALRFNLRSDWQMIHLVTQSDLRHNLALMSLTSLFPALLMAIRWSSTFGDSSRLGATLVNYMLHAVNLALLGVLVWVTFDPPFSASQLAKDAGYLLPALTLYYIAALCIGYYCGYILLIFGRKPIRSQRGNQPEPALPASLQWLSPVIAAGTLAAVILAAGLLIYKNAPAIQVSNGDLLLKYARASAEKLPASGAIVLFDSDIPGKDLPWRGYVLQAWLCREGREQKFPVVNTAALNFPAYQNHLHQQFPHIWPQIVNSNELKMGVSPFHIFSLLNDLSKSNNLCYLNPSFGYFFEQFYQEPHGLMYVLKPLPADTLLPPVLNANLIAENEASWREILDRNQLEIKHATHPPNYKKMPGMIGWCMQHLHVTAEPDPNAIMALEIYSQELNTFGVQVQRAGDLEKANSFFHQAYELNTNNVVAGINLEYNEKLRAGSSSPVNLSEVTPDRFGKYRSWPEVVGINGPFDQPSFCFESGLIFLQNQPIPLFREALAQFDRVRQLAPDNLTARLFMAQVYLAEHLQDKALDALRDPLAEPARFALTKYNATELNVLTATAYFQKNENAAAINLLEKEMELHPDDENLLLACTKAFQGRGFYTNALHAINRQLARTPDDPTWILGKGIASLQVGAYDDSVAALSRMLQLQTNNPDALFNRAVAYLKSGRLDAARADFLNFQTLIPNNLQVAYSLGEIAWRQHATNEVVRNYQMIVANAPTNTPELKEIRERLTQLGVK